MSSIQHEIFSAFDPFEGSRRQPGQRPMSFVLTASVWSEAALAARLAVN
jgi:hypothetical protein